MKNDINTIVSNIVSGDIDINTHDSFISILIKGLLLKLNSEIKIRGIYVPHIIVHTGDDIMWNEARSYNNAIEPLTISNENNVYSIIPRCIVNPSGVDLDTSQLTSPYILGNLQYESKDKSGVYSLYGEFRRIPIKLSIELKYYTDTYSDMLELIQGVIANLAFIRTYDIVYLGQKIKCSYKIPESFSEEHTMDIDGAMSDNREHNLTLSIEVETNMPVFNNKTIMPYNIITKTKANIHTNLNAIE